MRILLFLLALTLSLQAQALSIEAGQMSLQEFTNTKGKTFYLVLVRGNIAYPMAIEFREMLEKMTKADQALLVDLDSGGGAYSEGVKILSLMRSERLKGRPVHTTVANGAVCGSMCVPVYLQGQNRYAGEIAAFMFHGVTTSPMSNIPNEAKTREALNLFLDAGVPQKWIELMWSRGVFTQPGEYWATGKDLVDEGAGIVTQLLPRHEVFEPQEAPFDPNLGSH